MTLSRVQSTLNTISRSMFRNVLNALNEALDITLHLHPLIEHFKVVRTEISQS